MARAKRASNGTAPGYRVHFYCPGCQGAHGIVTGAPDSWGFNGDYDRPTFTPSVLIRGNQWPKDEYPEYYKPSHARVQPGEDTVCHSFVVDGRIQFLSDCTHDLAGQTVELPEWKP